jgi:cyclopropane-fatty-acyl-phospholipid synthase
MWDRMLDRMLRDFVRSGRAGCGVPDGAGLRQLRRPGRARSPCACNDPGLPRRLVLRTELTLGEAYMDGTLTIDGDDLEGLLSLATGTPRSRTGCGGGGWPRAAAARGG